MIAGCLLCMGYGYTAKALVRSLGSGWCVMGTTRSAAAAEAMRADGVEPIVWPGEDVTRAMDEATHLLSSVPPSDAGDPVHELMLTEHGLGFDWVGLLSTTGVYGDHGGNWVDETAPLVPATHRGGLRARQDAAWTALHERHRTPVHRFRLAGIYGPGRSALDRVRAGTARRIVKPGQVFSRIHVDDIAQVLHASIRQPSPGRAFNVADDLPAPPQDVIAYAATLLGEEPPPEIPFGTADLSPMARSFYADNKRISNARIKAELGVELRYRDYRAGLAAILAGGG